MQVDAFCVHERLISDSCSFAEGFVEIHDKRIREHVEMQSAEGAQWLARGLNPAFNAGGRVSGLVAKGLLHPECERIFRIGNAPNVRDRDAQGSERHWPIGILNLPRVEAHAGL